MNATVKKKAQGDVTAEYEAALKKRKTDHYVLRLYIAGNNIRSQTAVENVKRICEEYLKGRYELEVIDMRRVIGDMTRKEKVLIGLDLVSQQ